MSDATESQVVESVESENPSVCDITSVIVELAAKSFQMTGRTPVFVQVIVALDDGDCPQSTFIHPELTGQDREAVANMVMHVSGETANRLRARDDKEAEAA